MQGGGDEGDVEVAVGVDVGNGERDAIEGDRALGDEVLGQIRRGAEGRPPLGVGVDRDTYGDAVDVAEHEMPVESVGQPQGPFDMDPLPGSELCERGLGEGLRDGIEGEFVGGAGVHKSQTNAVDCDGVAMPGRVGMITKRRAQNESQAIWRGFDGLHFGLMVNDPGEHERL